MILNSNVSVRDSSYHITKEQKALAKAYIQGAVHAHCNCNPGEAFSVRKLFGGDNRDWYGTPLQMLYDSHVGKVKNPEKSAAQDAGILMKQVLIDDAREFECVGQNTGKEYRLINANIICS